MVLLAVIEIVVICAVLSALTFALPTLFVSIAPVAVGWLLQPRLRILFPYAAIAAWSTYRRQTSKTGANIVRLAVAELSTIFWRTASCISIFAILASPIFATLFSLILFPDLFQAAPGKGAAAIDNEIAFFYSIAIGCGTLTATAACVFYLLTIYRLQVAKGRFQSLKDQKITLDDVKGQILYLRAFVDDRKWAKLPFGSFLAISITEEERTVTALSSVGKVIAIGKPEERIPPVGAGRLYFADSTWKEAAKRMMNDAYIILLVPNTTDGVLWEFETIATNRYIDKLVLQIPAELDASTWSEFRGLVHAKTGLKLPEPYTPGSFLLFHDHNNFDIIVSIVNLRRLLYKRKRSVVTGKAIAPGKNANNPMDRSGGSAAP